MRSLNAWLDALVQNRNETGTSNRYRKPPFYYIYSYTS